MREDNRNPFRWVVAEINKTGNPAAQYPLPVTKQGIRALFELREPMVVPAYFVTDVGGLPVWTKDNNGNTIQESEKYSFRIDEIDEQYQSIDGIRKFIEESEKNGSDINAEFGKLVIGLSSMPQEMKPPIERMSKKQTKGTE